jgi:hypothetical protein
MTTESTAGHLTIAQEFLNALARAVELGLLIDPHSGIVRSEGYGYEVTGQVWEVCFYTASDRRDAQFDCYTQQAAQRASDTIGIGIFDTRVSYVDIHESTRVFRLGDLLKYIELREAEEATPAPSDGLGVARKEGARG